MPTGDRAAGRTPLSVVVPTRDRPQMLDRCLRSVRAALREDDQLVVVDSASSTEAAESIAGVAARHRATLLRCDRPGVNRARNAGWAATRYDLVVFTDDDVEVDAGWADSFAQAARTRADAAFFTGWIGVPAGEDRRWEVAVKDDGLGHPLGPATRGILGQGASLAVRRTALAGVGGWDEALGSGARFGSAPEVDLFDRLFAAGHTGWFEPAAKAWHHQWRSKPAVIRLNLRYGVGTGARVAKLLRTDPRRAVVVARECWWSWGVWSLAQRLRHADKTGVLVDLARMAGYLAGFVLGALTPVRAGHFAPRRG